MGQGAMYRGRQKLRGENSFEGGLNQGASLFALRDNESTDEVGWDTDGYPSLTTRRGRSTYGSSGAAVTYLLAPFGNTHMVRAVGTALQYDNAGTWTAITGTFTAADWDWTNFNDKLIITNGTDEVKQWDGSALSNLNATDAPQGKYITNDTNRVWIADGDTLYWCAFLDETDWTTAEDSGSVQYYTERGGDITAIRRFYDRITLFKKDAMAEIQGQDYFSYRLVEISNDIGCVSFKTLQEVGDTLFWLGQNDVYGYRGGKPFPIGQRIRDYLSRINTTHLSKCCAGTDGIKYYLCLVVDDATEPNVRLVYDPRYDMWRVCAEDEDYRYWVLFNNVPYAGDDAGQTYKAIDPDASQSAVEWSFVTKPFDEGMPEAEKTYLDLHLQGLFPTGTTVTVSVSTQDRGGTFTQVDYDPTTAADYGQSRNVLIPLDTVPLSFKTRFKVSGTGPVELERMQRYFRIQQVQR